MQSNKTISAIIGIFVIGVAGWLALPPTPRSAGVGAPTGSARLPDGQVGAYTLAQVATHADASNCWSVIKGEVYDLTSFIAQHPGGEGNILIICGKDGTDAFSNQHGGQRRPEQILATLKIGTLAQ